jgi:hypothetical protein
MGVSERELVARAVSVSRDLSWTSNSVRDESIEEFEVEGVGIGVGSC